MICSLRIQNIFPFEKISIDFSLGLNILTGESGAGKSAFITALGFLLGGNGDRKMLRPEAAHGFVEGEFRIEDSSSVKELLEENEIELENASFLVLRTQLFQTSKTRAFINDQVVTISLLQKIGYGLIDLVSQHSHQELLSSQAQRDLIDLFGHLSESKTSYCKSYRKLLQMEKSIEELETHRSKIQFQKQEYSTFLQEIEQAKLGKDEEEEITKEHHILAHAQEILEKVQQLHYDLSDKPDSLVLQIEETGKILKDVLDKDPSLKETVSLAQTIKIELQELTYQIRHYLGRVEPNPERLFEIEERLKVIETLKKKFGKNYEEIEEKRVYFQKSLENLSTADETVNTLKQEAILLKKEVDKRAEKLTFLRKSAAQTFQKSVTSELRLLNMPHAQFQVEILPKERSENGEDLIVFSFSANKGISSSPLKGIASGGELSRLLLAMKITIGEEEKNKPMVFDEIDANVGGQTAALIGEKLKKLGSMRQVLSITHFVQVAKWGDSHYRLTKVEVASKAKSTISKLLEKEKEAEYQRMIGLS